MQQDETMEEVHSEEELKQLLFYKETIAIAFNLNPIAQRYCIKQEKAILLTTMKPLECIRCPENICNDGNCDPL